MEDIMSKSQLVSDESELQLRPQALNEYIGQNELKENLAVFIQAARLRNEVLDHVMFYGPPGLGKTTLANIIANEMETSIKYASGPTIEKSGDLAAIFSTLDEGDVLFIDEIHRIPKTVEEVLYPAMEDYCLDVLISSRDGVSKSIRVDLPKFTLVAATTRAGDIGAPLRDRFGIVAKLEYYRIEELQLIIKRTATVLDSTISDSAAYAMAKRSRGTPRIANRLFRRVRDFAMVAGLSEIDEEFCNMALDKLRVDDLGLDRTDHEYLLAIIEKYSGGPAGVEAIAASIGEEKTTLEDVYEPYLLQLGFIKRTQRGRIATAAAYEHLKISKQEELL